jgi:glycosyltransferase involved in cell wall biosynthesis
MTLLAILFAVVAAACFATSVQLQHGAVRAANTGPVLGRRALWRAIRSRRWLGGTAVGVTGSALHATALSIAPLVVVQPIGVLSLVLTVVLGRRIRDASGWAALVAVCVGVAGFVVVATLGSGDATAVNPTAVQPFVLIAVAVLVLGRATHTRARCVALAAAAAVFFGTGSALIKAASWDIFGAGDLASGLGLAAESVLLIVIGGWVVHQAYAAGPSATVIAVTTVIDPLTAVVIGLWCYGEATQLTAVSYVALVAFAGLAATGVIALSRTLRDPSIPEENPVMAEQPHQGGQRILIAADTFPPDINGAAHFADRLARGLAARGHDVHVVCPSPTGAASFGPVGAITVHRVKSLRTPFHPTFRFSTPRQAAHMVGPLVDRLRPDVVHVQSHFAVGRSVLAAAVGRGVPVIATNHFMPENLLGFAPMPRWLKDRLASWAWRDLVKVFGQATVVTSPTPRAVELLAAEGFPGRALAISCGVDLAHYATERTPRGDDVSVLFVGRLDKEKNVDELLRALPSLPGVRAEIVGDGSRKHDLTTLAEQLGVADRVLFHGFLSDADVVHAYQRCDIFCMPGTAELQSIATMEAMAAGLPVVAANAMALPHLVRPGVTGFLFPPGDVDQLAASLATLTADPALRATMGRAGYEMISRHGLEGTLDAYEDLYFGADLRVNRPALAS